MIDTRNQNYNETLLLIEELQEIINKVEKNIILQLPQGVSSQFEDCKTPLIDLVDEAQFIILNDYKVD